MAQKMENSLVLFKRMSSKGLVKTQRNMSEGLKNSSRSKSLLRKNFYDNPLLIDETYKMQENIRTWTYDRCMF